MDVWKEDRLGGYVDIRVDDRTRGAVLALNMPHEVLIEDVQAQIDAQVANRKSEVKINNEFFEDYHTYDEEAGLYYFYVFWKGYEKSSRAEVGDVAKTCPDLLRAYCKTKRLRFDFVCMNS